MISGGQIQRRSEAGFTLIEMLVVVVIIAISASIALPLLGRPSDTFRLQTTAGDFVAALRITREAAILRNAETALMIDVEGRTLQSQVVPRRSFAPDVIAKLEFAAPEWTARSTGGFRFFPDGSSTGGTVTLSLHDKQAKIYVLWLTGEARPGPNC
jgi:general secretion pathway protein H